MNDWMKTELLTFVLLFLLSSHLISSSIYYIGGDGHPNGKDCSTPSDACGFSEAIDKTAKNDILFILSAEYVDVGDIYISKDISIFGTSNVVIKGSTRFITNTSSLVMRNLTVEDSTSEFVNVVGSNNGSVFFSNVVFYATLNRLLYVESSSKISFKDCSFKYIDAMELFKFKTGGIHYLFEMESCKFEYFCAQINLEGIRDISIRSSNFIQCDMFDSPLIYIESNNSNIEFTNISMTSTMKILDGVGHIIIRGANRVITQYSKFEDLGGIALDVHSSVLFKVTDCLFYNIDAGIGFGSLSISNTSQSTLESCTFEKGSALYMNNNGSIRITDCKFTDISMDGVGIIIGHEDGFHQGYVLINNSFFYEGDNFRPREIVRIYGKQIVDILNNTLIDDDSNEFSSESFVSFNIFRNGITNIIGGYYRRSHTNWNAGIIQFSYVDASPGNNFLYWFSNSMIFISGVTFSGYSIVVNFYYNAEIRDCDFIGKTYILYRNGENFTMDNVNFIDYLSEQETLVDVKSDEVFGEEGVDYIRYLRNVHIKSVGVRNAVFDRNNEGNNPLGGVIRVYAANSKVSIENVTVENSKIGASDKFAMIYVQTAKEKYFSELIDNYELGSEVMIRDCLFSNVTIDRTPMIYLYLGENTEREEFAIENCVFHDIKFTNPGSVIKVQVDTEYKKITTTPKSNYVRIDNCTLQRITSATNDNRIIGAGINNQNGGLYVSNSDFYDLEARFGAAIYGRGGEIVIEKCTFQHLKNSWTLETGSVHLINSKLVIRKTKRDSDQHGTIFKDSEGSCIFLFSSQFVIGHGTLFSSCVSQFYGGGLSFVGFGELDSTYWDDEGMPSGSDAEWDKKSRLLSGVYQNCTSKLGGGGISLRYNYKNDVIPKVGFHCSQNRTLRGEISSCSSKLGGAMYLENVGVSFSSDLEGTCDVFNEQCGYDSLSIFDNVASEYGGAIYMKSSTINTFTYMGEGGFDFQFSRNQALMAGGNFFDTGIIIPEEGFGQGITCCSNCYETICQEQTSLNQVSYVNLTNFEIPSDNPKLKKIQMSDDSTALEYGNLYATAPLSFILENVAVSKKVLHWGEEFEMNFLVKDAFGQKITMYTDMFLGIERTRFENVYLNGPIFESQIVSDGNGLVKFSGLSFTKFESKSDIYDDYGNELVYVDVVARLVQNDGSYVGESVTVQFKLGDCPRGYEREAEVIIDTTSESSRGVVNTISCRTCAKGYYSVMRNMIECKKCPKNSDCSDPSQVIPDEGYWSYVQTEDENSDEYGEVVVLFCPNGNCLGNNKCKGNYDGDQPLCASCIEGFSEWNGSCVKCDSFDVFKFVIISLIVIFLCYQVFSVHKNSQQLESSIERIYSFFGNTYKHILRNMSFRELNQIITPVLSLVTAFQIPVQTNPKTPGENSDLIDFVLFPFTWISSQIFRCPYERSSSFVIWSNFLEPLFLFAIILVLLLLCYLFKCWKNAVCFSLFGCTKISSVRRKVLSNRNLLKSTSVEEEDESYHVSEEEEVEEEKSSSSGEDEDDEDEDDEVTGSSSEESEGGEERSSSGASSGESLESGSDQDEKEEEAKHTETKVKRKKYLDEVKYMKEKKEFMTSSPYEYWKKMFFEEIEVRKSAFPFDPFCIITGLSCFYPFLKVLYRRFIKKDDDDDDAEEEEDFDLGTKLMRKMNLPEPELPLPYEILAFLSFCLVGIPSWLCFQVINGIISGIGELFFHIHAYQLTFLNLTIISYQLILENSLSVVNCLKYNDEYRMMKYTDVKCFDSGEYYLQFLVVFFIPMLYCVLYPLVILFFLFTQKRNLYGDTENRKSYSSKLGCFYLCYRRKCWWYEVFSIYRKLVIVVLIVLSQSFPTISDYILSFVLVFSLVIHLLLRPYRKCFDNVLEGLGLGCLTVLQLIRTSDVSDEYGFVSTISIIVTFVPVFFILTYLKFRISLIFILGKIEKFIVKKCLVSCCICLFPCLYSFDYCCCYNRDDDDDDDDGQTRNLLSTAVDDEENMDSELDEYEDEDEEALLQRELENYDESFQPVEVESEGKE